MLHFYLEYFTLLCFFIVSSVLASILVLLSTLFAPKKSDFEKLSAYECGFRPFDKDIVVFDLHFFLVALFFLVFDLELIYLIPWIYLIGDFALKPNFWFLLVFLFFLVLGFIYEWNQKALDW